MLNISAIGLRFRGAFALLSAALLSVALLMATTAAAPAQNPVSTVLGAVTPAAPSSAAASPAPAVTPEAVNALISILKDDAARQALIDNLSKMSAGAAPSASAPAAAGAAAPPASGVDAKPAATPATGEAFAATPFVGDIGAITESLARQVLDVIVKVGYGLGNLRRLIDGTAAVDWESLRELVFHTAAALVVAVAIYYFALRLSRRALFAISGLAAGKRWLIRLVWAALGLASEVAALGFALIVAAIYVYLASSDGHADPLTEQVLGGFVTVEFLQLVLRALFQGRFPALAVLPCSEETARYWRKHLARLVAFLGYGVLVAHPIVNRLLGFSVGIGFRMVVVLIALAGAVILILRNRERVQRGLIAAISGIEDGVARTSLTLAIHAWHILAVLYLTVAFLLWVSRPFDAVDFMARATVETLLVVVLGGAVSNVITRRAARGVRVPDAYREILPLLEKRINLVVPFLFRATRLVVILAVAALILQAWGLVDFWGWATTDAGANAVGRVSSAFIIVLVAVAIWLAASSWVEFRLNPTVARDTNARTRTLLSLFRNAFTILLIVIAAMLTLSELGIDIAPLIAGAGVVGLAVGFGSQKLVQDIITGAFIQLENAMNEGDVVTIADVTGVVDRLTIRSVGIRDLDGVYHIIPFSSVSSVSNFMRGFSYHVANIGVAYKEDIDEVKAAMQAAFDLLMQTDRGPTILEPLEMHGVTEFGDNAITVRARIKTMPGEQWAAGRVYNEMIKKVFDERGIEIPFPQRTVWMAGGSAEPPVAGKAAAAASESDPSDAAPPSSPAG